MVRLNMDGRILIIRSNIELEKLVDDMKTDIELLYKVVNLDKSDTLSFIYAKYNERLYGLLCFRDIESLDTIDIIKNMINDIYK